MEAILEAIFSNFFLILVILSGIFSFFKKNTEDQKKNKTPSKQKTKPKTVQPSARSTETTKKRPVYTSKIEDTIQESLQQLSVEEQQKAQMERLAEKFNTNKEIGRTIEQGLDFSQSFSNSKILKTKQIEKRTDFNMRLKRNDLVQGVILSEVLGSPRSKKPYQTVIEERKMKFK
ncbi:hypothetical protein [Oceanobacillus sp. Castelsardo]|uniref:hypothetical protein n=1 Tax=Oceanobacillus sp. Castelsardo TaxID=1851204 RepID=UPI0008387850|nr:hypothetical protein [Oceanobacillus sp. Castelsardo]